MQNFCPRIAKVTVHGETKGQYRTTKPTIAHHTITTARRPDNIHSSALVWGRSTQFMASPCRWQQRRFPETRLHFRHFIGLSRLLPGKVDTNPHTCNDTCTWFASTNSFACTCTGAKGDREGNKTETRGGGDKKIIAKS